LLAAGPARPHSGEDLEAPASYAEIDAALEGVVLLEPDAVWRYFVGTEDPAEEFGWGKKNYDDSGWLEGRAPFGYGGDWPVNTTVEEIGEGVTTVYLRQILEVPDKTIYARILLELPIDDGYVLFVRGNEEDRLHSDSFEVVNPFDAFATSERKLDTPPMPVFDLTPTVKDTQVLIALQTLVHEDDRGTWGFRPRVWARWAVTPEGEARRLEELRPLLEGEDAAPLRAYLEGRHFQRLGDFARAIPHFRVAADLDPESAEPWQRLRECHLGAGRPEELDAHIREAIEAGSRSPAMLDTFAASHLDDLGRSAPDLVADLPQGDDYPARGRFADTVWAGCELGRGRALRIDCGASEDTPAVGNGDSGWSRDRCHFVGEAVVSADAEGVGRTSRACERNLEELLPVYRIPAAPGLYELRLTFEGRAFWDAEPGDAVLDVLVEGARAVRTFDPVVETGGGSAVVSLPVRLMDSVLELDLLTRSADTPAIAGVELFPVEAARFAELAEERVRATDRRSAYALSQLAEARLVEEEPEAAFALLEEAERLPDFHPDQRVRLAGVRDALLPRLLSFATAEDLVQRHGDDARDILHAVRARGEDDVNATYLEGVIELAAGRIEEAIGAFEALVGDGSEEPGAWLGMAICLAESALEEEAAGFIEEALAMGVEPAPELLQLYVSLELDRGTDPWDLLAKLRELGAPDELWIVPTSELAPLTWRYTAIEPPANAWSRPTYEDGHWELGPAGFGSGHTKGGSSRSFWNTEKVFARYRFQSRNGRYLYPHADVHANDAADVYMNGTRVSRVSLATDGYVRMPLADPNIGGGDNILGIFGFNVRDDSSADVGLVQPIADLAWIADELADDGFIRLNCGGPEYTTADGRVFSEDRLYGWAGGGSAEDPEVDVQGTEDDELYRTYRWFYDDSGNAWYQVPVPNGSYRITLHFAEVDPGRKDAGPFNVRIETVLVLEEYDVADTAGLATLATHTFDTQVTDGYLDVLFNHDDNRSFLSALEIEKTD
jgi:tetratricopeptide (TPR) repeat protein